MKIMARKPIATVRFQCPACGQDFEAPRAYSGREVFCDCGRKVYVPGLPSGSREEKLWGRVGPAIGLLLLFFLAWSALAGIGAEEAQAVMALGIVFCIIAMVYFLPLWIRHAVKICLGGGIIILFTSVLMNYLMGAILGGFLAVVGAILLLRK